MNTCLEYLYRDADNYRVSGRAILAGPCDLALRDRIARSTLDPEPEHYGLFIPGLVGLPDLQNRFYEASIRQLDALIASAEDLGDPVRLAVAPEEIARWQTLRADMATTPPQWDPERDHPFHVLEDIRLTAEDPTDPRTVAEFAAAMEAAHWDPHYLPPFHAEMLANFEAARAKRAEADAGATPDSHP
ncbi:hypothetical protein LAZ40_09700 [Cereibacter sphaeroides]|uniref:hypothetical protein n=1 Tax=Cereibacter sphaeroides TaxID=1063 RepID=UPI001F2B7AC9|nr:hypothetical protein [Cereibacter sphaeroides]MCE6959324.1 hypothetical protein [Cereibacter sphaeroides]MCE6972916.1 hypothetical protein [Cereibacter sphaeroides]